MNAEKWHHSQICIAINDESQGSIAKKLLLSFTLMVKEFLRLVNIWQSYGQDR